MVYKSVNDWINEFLNQVSCLGLNVEPEQFEGGIVCGQAFKVSRNEALALQVLLALLHLKIAATING